jgi:hypothetical protein
LEARTPTSTASKVGTGEGGYSAPPLTVGAAIYTASKTGTGVGGFTGPPVEKTTTTTATYTASKMGSDSVFTIAIVNEMIVPSICL